MPLSRRCIGLNGVMHTCPASPLWMMLTANHATDWQISRSKRTRTVEQREELQPRFAAQEDEHHLHEVEDAASNSSQTQSTCEHGHFAVSACALAHAVEQACKQQGESRRQHADTRTDVDQRDEDHCNSNAISNLI